MTLSTTAESRITQIADQTVAGTLTRSFGYDNAERLTTESDSDGTFQTTTPDAAGNITAQSGTLRNATFTFNALNQATARSVPSGTTGYGAGALDPNVFSRRYDYDAEHRIVKISYIDGSGALTGATTTIGYDGLSRWTTMTEQGAPVNGVMPTPVTTHYRWCGDTLCQARDGNDNVLATYYDEGVAQGSGGVGMALYYQKNQVGTVQAVIDGNGALVSSTRYDAWGNPSTAPVGAAGVLPLGFAGLYYHQQSGLHFAEHRMYDPSSMRWLNRDPIEEQGGLNLYAYAGGNPVRFDDPSGHLPIFIVTAAIGGIGGFVGNVGIQLYKNGWNVRCVNWGDAGIAGTAGLVAGAFLPVTGITWAGAALTGAATNLAGYYATNWFDATNPTVQGAAIAAGGGLVGGALGGAFANPTWFQVPLSPWVQDAEVFGANFTRSAVARSIGGGTISSEDPTQ
jgi:RHS repeat-associated protein